MARVRLFANLRELAGASSLEVAGETVADVLGALGERFGDAFVAGLAHSRVWKNGDEAQPDDPVSDGDEVAVIPPVSGGAGLVQPGDGAESYEPFILGLAVLLLLAANALWGIPVFAAVLVGVASLWAVDLSHDTTARGLPVDIAPLLAAILGGALTAAGYGSAGLGIGAALAVVIAMGWPIFHAPARELNTIAALLLASVIGSLGVGSLLLARLSSDGDDKVGAFLLMSLAAAAVGWLVSRMVRPIMDQFTAGSIAAIVAAVAVAQLNELDLITWLLVGLVVSVSLVAGRAIGSAFRTGEIHLAERGFGTMASLDGPMMAAAVFLPVLRVIP